MGDTASQLANSLHLLRLPQLLGDGLALPDFLQNLLMGGIEFGRALRDALLKRLVQAAESKLGSLPLTDVDAGAGHVLRAAR